MSVIGVVIAPNASHPRLHAVVLDGTLREPIVAEVFERRAAASDPSEQAVELARLLSPKVVASIGSAGIRVAGTTPVARRNQAAFSRAHCEGAVLFVLREATRSRVATIVPLTAPKTLGIQRADLDRIIASVSDSGANADAVLAGLAAFAGAR